MYKVTWTIYADANIAKSPKEAAEYALEIMRDPDSIATVFSVTNKATGEKFKVDLLEDVSYTDWGKK